MPESGLTQETVYNRLSQKKTAKSDFLDAEVIVRYGACIGSVIEQHRSLPRAMGYARDLIDTTVKTNRSVASGRVILAQTMTDSKGRFDRSWYAPPGGLWGCVIHADTLLPQSRRFIPFSVGLACCQAMREVGAAGAVLRWVNDVLIGGKKVAGFLVESYVEPVHGEEFSLVGFGVNLNNDTFPRGLSDSAISLKQILAKKIDIDEFAAIFLANLAWNIGLLYHEEERKLRQETLFGSGKRHALVADWLAHSDVIGKRVVYGFDVVTAPQYQAEVQGLDDHGGLILRLEDGHEKTEYSGEIRYL